VDLQEITNGLEARQPEHLLKPPVPVTVRVVWAVDGMIGHSGGSNTPDTTHRASRHL
jgi:hypothetical protein